MRKVMFLITRLPGYAAATTANPFKTFAELPALSRYRFMLDDARFFVEGFIKGPVCRGQVALNVINDHFRAHPLSAGGRVQCIRQSGASAGNAPVYGFSAHGRRE